MAFNWTCPFCQHAQVVIAAAYDQDTTTFRLENMAEDKLALERTAIVCSNGDCRRTTIKIRIGNYQTYSSTYSTHHLLLENTIRLEETLAPRGSAKPQPEFIPSPLVDDYTEACLIRDLSPKASATLARRCLQGMIRDFAGIAKKRLIDEIRALKTAIDDGSADRAVTPETVAAIDHVRSLGNIGAHMEADIDLIVPVEAGEAQAMIELIEMLFDEWYGARHRREQKLARIAEIRAGKDEIKLGAGGAVNAAEASANGAAALLEE